MWHTNVSAQSKISWHRASEVFPMLSSRWWCCLNTSNAVCFEWYAMKDVWSHPVKVWKAGRELCEPSGRLLKISCTGIYFRFLLLSSTDLDTQCVDSVQVILRTRKSVSLARTPMVSVLQWMAGKTTHLSAYSWFVLKFAVSSGSVLLTFSGSSKVPLMTIILSFTFLRPAQLGGWIAQFCGVEVQGSHPNW